MIIGTGPGGGGCRRVDRRFLAEVVDVDVEGAGAQPRRPVAIAARQGIPRGGMQDARQVWDDQLFGGRGVAVDRVEPVGRIPEHEAVIVAAERNGRFGREASARRSVTTVILQRDLAGVVAAVLDLPDIVGIVLVGSPPRYRAEINVNDRHSTLPCCRALLGWDPIMSEHALRDPAALMWIEQV